jgi:hypothetical protein
VNFQASTLSHFFFSFLLLFHMLIFAFLIFLSLISPFHNLMSHFTHSFLLRIQKEEDLSLSLSLVRVFLFPLSPTFLSLHLPSNLSIYSHILISIVANSIFGRIYTYLNFFLSIKMGRRK